MRAERSRGVPLCSLWTFGEKSHSSEAGESENEDDDPRSALEGAIQKQPASHHAIEAEVDGGEEGWMTLKTPVKALVASIHGITPIASRNLFDMGPQLGSAPLTSGGAFRLPRARPGGSGVPAEQAPEASAASEDIPQKFLRAIAEIGSSMACSTFPT